jgi:hypothetical protein
VLAIALLVPLTAVLVTTQNHAAGDIAQADQTQSASVVLREMDQQLREAYQLEFPTASANTGCPVTSGIQPCNQIDFLARLTGTGFTGTDFEVHYDCTATSQVVTGDRACMRYLCSASSATGSGSMCMPGTAAWLSTTRMIDPLVNGTSADPVFSLCYPSTLGAGCGASTATRATSATVTVKTPATPNQATANGGDPATVVLTDGVYFPNLDYAQ